LVWFPYSNFCDIDGDKNEITRVNVTDQKNRIFKLFYSYVQTSKYRRDKSEKKELTNSNE